MLSGGVPMRAVTTPGNRGWRADWPNALIHLPSPLAIELALTLLTDRDPALVAAAAAVLATR